MHGCINLFVFLCASAALSSPLIPVDVPADAAFFELERKAASGEDNRQARGICLLYGYGTPVRIYAAKKCLSSCPVPGTDGEPYFFNIQGLEDAALFQKAEKEADNLSVPAMRITAFCCWFGRGTQRDRLKAVSFYRRAASAGDPVSIAFLAQLTGDAGLYDRTLRLNRAMKAFPRAYLPVLIPEDSGNGLVMRDKESVSVFLSRLLAVWRAGKPVRVLMGKWE